MYKFLLPYAIVQVPLGSGLCGSLCIIHVADTLSVTVIDDVIVNMSIASSSG